MKIITALVLAVVVVWVGSNLHPHYDNCHRTTEGRVCTLTHYTWGK